MSRVRSRLPAILASAGVALIALAPAAAAHVAVDSAAPAGDGTSTVTLVWDHSCTPETGTTEITVSAGPGVEFIGGTTDLAGWSATVDASTATFGGPAVPTAQRAAVAVTARITATPGASVTFPSVQHCGDRQVAWTDPDPAADHPAPTLIATAAIATPPATADPAAPADAGAGLGAALTGVLALAAGAAAVGVLVTRRASR